MTPRASGTSGRPSAAHDPQRLELWRRLTTLVASGDAALRRELLATHDLAVAQWRMLDSLAVGSAPMSVGVLAQDLGLAISTVSRQIDRLEEQGWVIRLTGSPLDHRHILVRLTPEGRALWRSATTTVRRVLRREVLYGIDDADLDEWVRRMGDATGDGAS